MSASVVQARYEELEQIAARFASAAEQQQALLERVGRQVEVLRCGGWQGKGVAAFLGEMDGEVKPAEQRLTGALLHASRVSGQIIVIIKQADIEASSPFQADRAPYSPESSGKVTESRQPSEYIDIHSAADLFNAIVDENTPPIQVLRVGDGPDGKGEYVVLLKGTHGWFEETPRTWFANPRSGLGIPTQYTASIHDAIEQAGIPPGATIHFAGHSQGGHNAQLVAKIYNDAGVYRVGSVTAFGAYQVVSLPSNIPVNTYMFPTDPINLANIAHDSLFYGPVGVVGRVFGMQPHTDDWVLEVGDHGGYGASPSMRNTTLPFSSSKGEVIDIPSEYADPKTKDSLQVVVEEILHATEHTTEALANSLPLLRL